MNEVYLINSRTWQQIIPSDNNFILAKDVDGVMTYVVNDPTAAIRPCKEE